MPNTDPIAPTQPLSETAEDPATLANSPTPPRPASPARLRANRANAQNSSGPKTVEGKKRSSLNATRHGLLAQTLHLPAEEMAAYHEFTASFVKDLSPLGVVETQLAHACADLQFRLNRIAAAEHNLFSIGHTEHGDLWEVDNPEVHTALAFAETLRNSTESLKTLSIYEQRLSRRFLQTFKQLREMQAERRTLEQQQLESLSHIAIDYSVGGHPRHLIANLDPADFGFVCSKQAWQLYYKRSTVPSLRKPGRAKAA